MPTAPQLMSQVNRDEIVTTAPCRADLAGGTIDMWPLYLFHSGAVSVNVAVNILTSCKITPRSGREIVLRSQDTGRHERFAGLDELLAANTYRHPLAAHLVRFFKVRRRGRTAAVDRLWPAADAGRAVGGSEGRRGADGDYTLRPSLPAAVRGFPLSTDRKS